MKISQLPAKLKRRLILKADYFLWLHSTGPLRRRRDHPPSDKTILVCALMAFPASVKAEALLMAAVRSRGFMPVVLLTSCSSILERCYRAVGPVRFIYLDDYRDSATWCASQNEARHLLN